MDRHSVHTRTPDMASFSANPAEDLITRLGQGTLVEAAQRLAPAAREKLLPILAQLDNPHLDGEGRTWLIKDLNIAIAELDNVTADPIEDGNYGRNPLPDARCEA